MAEKTYEVVVPKRYGTRMLQAGDTIELTNPRGRIYSALGFVKPFVAKRAQAPEPVAVIPDVDEVLSAEVVEEPATAPKPAPKKAGAPPQEGEEVTGSLAFRKNREAILSGRVPEKYTRLLPYIPHGRVIELGAAEGVLSLLLARRGDDVRGVERQRERYMAALELARAWRVSGASFINADIRERADLFDDQDTLVAVRMIYYLRGDLDAVFSKVAAKVNTVVLCGNKNRAAWWKQGIPDREDGAVNYYASREGMRELLERHGYTITQEVTDGDPIVVGVMDRSCADQVQDRAA